MNEPATKDRPVIYADHVVFEHCMFSDSLVTKGAPLEWRRFDDTLPEPFQRILITDDTMAHLCVYITDLSNADSKNIKAADGASYSCREYPLWLPFPEIARD